MAHVNLKQSAAIFHGGIDYDSPDEILMARESENENPNTGAFSDIAPDTLLTILRFLIPPFETSGKKRFKVAMYKMMVLAHACGMDEIGDRSLSQLAAEVGVSRALLSHYAVRLTDQLQEETPRGGKCRSSRDTFRRKACEYHAKAGHALGKTPPRPAFSA